MFKVNYREFLSISKKRGQKWETEAKGHSIQCRIVGKEQSQVREGFVTKP